MATPDDEVYYRARERQSRLMAAKARDRTAQHIHAALAALYAERARLEAVPPHG